MRAPADSPVCARCAGPDRTGGEGGTCCRLAPGQEEFCFPLSAPEREAMAAAGATAEHFVVQANSEAFVDNLKRLFPGEGERVEALFPAGAEHHRLALDEGGACLLLGPAGCLLPREARPHYCLLFPFWILGGRQRYFEFAQCQAQRESRAGTGLMELLGMTREGVRETYNRLRRSWGLPERP